MEQEAALCRARNDVFEFGYQFHFLEKLFFRSSGVEQIPMPGNAILDETATARWFFQQKSPQGVCCSARFRLR